MPERKNYATDNFESRAEEREFGTSLDHDPQVQAALDIMERHADQLDDESDQFNTLIERYGQLHDEINATTDAERRQQLEQQLHDLRVRIRQDQLFNRHVEDALALAITNEAGTRRMMDRGESERELSARFMPKNPDTEQAQLFFNSRRVQIAAEKLFQTIIAKKGKLDQVEQQAIDNELPKLRNRLGYTQMDASEGFAEIAQEPERLPVERWQEILDGFQTAFEEVLLLYREVDKALKAKHAGVTAYHILPPEQR